MDEPLNAPEVTADSPPPMSLGGRLLNVIATPGEVFDQIKNTPASVGNWLAPTLIAAVLAAIAAMVILSNPAVLHQIREQQAAPIEKKVAAGEMSRENADKVLAQMEQFSSPALMKVFGAAGATIASFVGVFWWAFLLWLIGRFALRGQVGYLKTLEVSGLATVIWALGETVRALLVLATANASATLSPALLLKHPDPRSGLFIALAMLNPIALWVVAVRSIGLAKLAGGSTARAAVWVFGVWAGCMAFLAAIGEAARRIFG